MNQTPRNGMTCKLCGKFSSAPRCYACSSSGIGMALAVAESRVAKLEGDLNKYQEAVKEIRALKIPRRSECIGRTHTFSLWAGVWGRMTRILHG